MALRLGRLIALLFHDRGTRRGWVISSTPRPHFTPGKDPVPILQEAGWALGPVWTGGKSRPHRDSISDRSARSHSLYRLSYPAHSSGGILYIYIYIYIYIHIYTHTYTNVYYTYVYNNWYVFAFSWLPLGCVVMYRDARSIKHKIHTTTKLRAERSGVQFPKGTRDTISPRRGERFWGPPSLLFNW